MSLTLSTDRHANPSGSLSPGELTFCLQTRALIRGALDGRVPFIGVVANLLSDLRELRKSGFDVEAATASGFAPAIASAELLAGTPTRLPLTTLERSFLEDLDGFLDYAIRNGLTFSSVLNVVMHDVTEIAAHEMSLENALRDYVTPKASGWAKQNVESARGYGAWAEEERGELD